MGGLTDELILKSFRLAVLVGDLVDFCLVCIVILLLLFFGLYRYFVVVFCCTCVHIGALFFFRLYPFHDKENRPNG